MRLYGFLRRGTRTFAPCWRCILASQSEAAGTIALKMSLAYTEDHLAAQPIFEDGALPHRGWAECTWAIRSEATFRQQLIALANQIGTPVATRSKGDICDTLKPTDASSANPNSLSEIHSLGEFPLHVDTAHWLTPCRYLILACLSAGSGDRPTLLLDTERLPLSPEQTSILRRTPFRVTNGRNSFFSAILSKDRQFVRYDQGCMASVRSSDKPVLDIFLASNWTDYVETIDWHKGKVIVIDNWRVLHGRGQASHPDLDRTLLRISIR